MAIRPGFRCLRVSMSIANMIERAKEAASRRNLDYAIQIYQEALGIEPDHADARRDLRALELRKWEAHYPSSMSAFFAGFPAVITMKISGLTKNHEGVMGACERYLTNDPKNLKINLRLGRAAASAGHVNAAVMAFETVVELDASNIEALKALGHLYKDNRDINKALLYFEKVMEIDPRDQDAARTRKDLAAEGALKVTGFADAKHSRDLIRDKDQAHDLEQRQKVGRSREDLLSEVRRLEKMVAESPGDLRLLLDLADHYIRARDFDAAIQSYERALEAEPENYPLREKIGDLRMMKIDERAQKAKKDLLERPDDEAVKRQIEQLDEERLALEVTEYRQRVAHHPTDLGLHMKLGRCLFKTGEIDDAIAEFQKTMQDPRRKAESLLMLGRCFFEKDMFDLAAKQLEKALEGMTTMTEQVKDIVYTLGMIRERQDDFAAANEQYARIFEVDISFRDVAKKLEAISKRMKE
jgi:tetratricopeptide (TPR) repeat protein